MDLLDPKNDYVFKRLFASSPELLAALISAVRAGEPAVEVLEVLNPRILPEELTGKTIELDVLARDTAGRLFNVEVQVQRFPRWSARSAYYLSRLLSTQIASGQQYAQLKPVVGVHLLDFDLFESHPSAQWHFEMRVRSDPAVRLGDELQLHVVELRKADRQLGRLSARGATGHESLAAWVAFLEHWQEIHTMAEVTYPPVQQAMKKLEELSLSEEERFRAIARERTLIDEATLRWEATEGKEEARREGRQAGLEEGRAEGRAEGRSTAKAQTLARQLTQRFGPLSEPERATIACATEAQLDSWLDGIFGAASAQDLLEGGGG
jgi:predicted transposase/invertase (TIGR01784 family)